jgi:hypothetical protein
VNICSVGDVKILQLQSRAELWGLSVLAAHDIEFEALTADLESQNRGPGEGWGVWITWHIFPIANTRRSGGKGENCKMTGHGHRSDRYKDRLILSCRIESRIVCINSWTIFCVVNLWLICLPAIWGPYFFSRIGWPIASWKDIFSWRWKQISGLYPCKRKRRRGERSNFLSSHFNSKVVKLLPMGGFGLQDENKLNKTLSWTLLVFKCNFLLVFTPWSSVFWKRVSVW